MALVLRVLALIIGVAVGTSFVKYNFQLTRLFGYNVFAEKILGEAGTYGMWKLLGVIVIVASVLFAFR